jgi:hypothetical protein
MLTAQFAKAIRTPSSQKGFCLTGVIKCLVGDEVKRWGRAVIVNVHKTRRFGDHVFTNSPCLFGDTGPGDGKLMAGVRLTEEGALLDSGKSSYRGPATISGA